MVQTITKGDYGYDLNFTVVDSDGTAVNLTSSTITFKMALPDSTTAFLSEEATIVGAEAGTCKYTVADGDMDTAGTYNAELQIAWSGKVQTATMADIEIVEDLP